MTKWDYLMVRQANDEWVGNFDGKPYQFLHTPEMLAAVGDDGWELAAALNSNHHETLLFKRPR